MRWLFTLTFVLIFSFSFAQFEAYEKQEVKHDTIVKRRDSLNFFHNMVFGGTFNLAFGTVTMVDLSPTAGFYVTKWLMPGIFVNFMYVRSRLANYQEVRWGPGAFIEAFPLEFLVFHSEYSIEHVYDNLNYKYIWTSRVNLGLGYRQKLGTKSMVNYMILFNVLKNPFYPPYEYRILFLF